MIPHSTDTSENHRFGGAIWPRRALPHRLAAKGVLPAVPGGAGQSGACKVLPGDRQGHVPEGRREWETLYKALTFSHQTELVPFDTSRRPGGRRHRSPFDLGSSGNDLAARRNPTNRPGSGTLSALKTVAHQLPAFDHWGHPAEGSGSDFIARRRPRRQIRFRLASMCFGDLEGPSGAPHPHMLRPPSCARDCAGLLRLGLGERWRYDPHIANHSRCRTPHCRCGSHLP